MAFYSIVCFLLGVVPLAVPLIVGPAVLTTSLILVNSFGFYPTVASIVLNILLCGAILRFSGFLSKILGEAGSHTLSKIFNLLLGGILGLAKAVLLVVLMHMVLGTVLAPENPLLRNCETCDELNTATGLALELIRGAIDMRVILSKAAHSLHSMKLS